MKNIKTYEEFEKGIKFEEYIKKISSIHSYLIYKYVEMYCDNSNLIDLEGMDKFTVLKKLFCQNNLLTSLKPLKSLINLDTIGTSENKLTNLDGIENLIKLEILHINYNKLTSLEGIENLINLRDLFCIDNKITSIKGIENLTKLETLYCRGNPIDWVDYIDKKGNTWYIILPKSIEYLESDDFADIEDYWYFIEKHQPAGVSRKFNF